MGSEKCVETLLEIFPEADLFTLIYDTDNLPSSFSKFNIHSSFLQRIPGSKKYFRIFLDLLPLVIEQFDLSEYDLVISSNHSVAKGALTGVDTVHICYCHTPMRYIWDLYHQYLREGDLEKGLKGLIFRIIASRLRIWDVISANRVDYFIANSNYVAKRIWKIYKRKAVVIHPPVDVFKFKISGKKENFFITVSRLVPYKRVDLIVSAFSELDLPLVVIGDGPEMKRIKKLASKNVELLGWQRDEVLIDMLGKARGFIYAAEEDFGIAPVEAMASGTPIIAYGKGGIMDYAVPIDKSKTPNAILFYEQSVESIKEAVKNFIKFENLFDSKEIRKSALFFNKERFKNQFVSYVKKVLETRDHENFDGRTSRMEFFF
jgi:glycosyltransferase involved in cell wall biosynthesis